MPATSALSRDGKYQNRNVSSTWNQATRREALQRLGALGAGAAALPRVLSGTSATAATVTVSTTVPA